MKRFLGILLSCLLGSVIMVSFQNCGDQQGKALKSSMELDENSDSSDSDEDDSQFWDPDVGGEIRSAAASSNGSVPIISYFYIHRNTSIQSNRLHLRFRCPMGRANGQFSGERFRNFALYINGDIKARWTSGCRRDETRSAKFDKSILPASGNNKIEILTLDATGNFYSARKAIRCINGKHSRGGCTTPITLEVNVVEDTDKKQEPAKFRYLINGNKYRHEGKNVYFKNGEVCDLDSNSLNTPNLINSDANDYQMIKAQLKTMFRKMYSKSKADRQCGF